MMGVLYKYSTISASYVFYMHMKMCPVYILSGLETATNAVANAPNMAASATKTFRAVANL